MSAVILKQDYKGKKAGTTVPDMPFLEAKELVNAGIAERLNPPAGTPKPPNEGDEVVMLRERVGTLTAEVTRLTAENADLSDQMAKAHKKGEAPLGPAKDAKK